MDLRRRLSAVVASVYHLSFVMWIVAEMRIVTLLVGWAFGIPAELGFYRNVVSLTAIALHLLAGAILFAAMPEYSTQLVSLKMAMWRKLKRDLRPGRAEVYADGCSLFLSHNLISSK